MRLATRLSAFFLASLAIVLVGFSVALFLSAWGYLNRQLDDRLAGGLAVLVAATEIHPTGVEWEPRSHELPLGQDTGPDRLRWMVHDGEGHRRIDHSRNLYDANLTDDWKPRAGDAVLPSHLLDRQGRSWRVVQRRLTPSSFEVASDSDAVSQGSAAWSLESIGELHPALMLTVAAPTGPVDRTLATLGWLLLGLSVSVWSLSAGLGRWLVRRALAPLTRTVASARDLDATDPGWSLPQAGTVDELDDLVNAFNDLLSRLRLAYERQRRFGADASHQLRTPLTALIGQIEVALRRDRSDAEYRRVLGLVRAQAGGLVQIVEALLFLGRAETDAGLPEAVRTDLSTWLVDHIGSHPLQALISLDLSRMQSSHAWASVHPPLLGQLLDNILDNAAKYGPPDGPIEVELFEQGRSLVLTVQDHGRGIAPEDLPQVFEPFFRSRQTRRLGRPGVGLGLAVVQRIATAFGGTVHVESECEKGCRFVLTLARLKPPPVSARRMPVTDSAVSISDPAIPAIGGER